MRRNILGIFPAQRLRAMRLRRRARAPINRSAQALLALAGTWEDDRDADEIIAELRASRRANIPPRRVWTLEELEQGLDLTD